MSASSKAARAIRRAHERSKRREAALLAPPDDPGARPIYHEARPVTEAQMRAMLPSVVYRNLAASYGSKPPSRWRRFVLALRRFFGMRP